jgi:threonylcarbamoyladenosine tRNA methylthiotransferase MtaB
MHRDYRPQEVYEAIRQLYNYFPEAAVGLDILTGFPTETAADFETTYNLVAALPLAYLHVFPFSPRPGTPAAQLRPLAAAEVQQRAAALRRLGREKKRAFYQRHLGTRREVLVEGPAPAEGWLIGLSDNYLRVLLPAVAARPNQRLWVRCQTLSGEALLAEPWAEDAYG